MGLNLSSSSVDQLDALLGLLAKWNRVYNLTGLPNEQKWVSHHLLDSLSIVRFLPPGRLLDLGSGGGFPGVPIAVAEPRREVLLLDSNNKKTAFLRQVVAELGVTNAAVETRRVEDFKPAVGFNVVVCRAFSDLPTFVRLAGRLCSGDGRLVAMKGTYPAQEIKQLPSAVVEKVIRLEVPLLEEQRHVVFLRPSMLTES
ncbi:MAG: 16S rRNA (guanine(527)-N(7))-methyltransferase RsmG [Betaproteobacteria bacterium]|jgi:16S rRNA (guanine527-N7)-methyltransferase|nr:MAG: 16S rRNA (guanine(527)-N(7))-methyltransferase RsmG [Betaproteobacteria bacterium]